MCEPGRGELRKTGWGSAEPTPNRFFAYFDHPGAGLAARNGVKTQCIFVLLPVPHPVRGRSARLCPGFPHPSPYPGAPQPREMRAGYFATPRPCIRHAGQACTRDRPFPAGPTRECTIVRAGKGDKFVCFRGGAWPEPRPSPKTLFFFSLVPHMLAETRSACTSRRPPVHPLPNKSLRKIWVCGWPGQPQTQIFRNLLPPSRPA